MFDFADFPQIPGEAFGDGSHPTTQLCARAVDWITRMERPRSFLDVGTGTGILARIARSRGCDFVCGTDIDPEALRSARQNAALDSSPVEIEIGDRAPDHWGPRFELVAANILEGPLKSLSGALARALAPGGTLLLSGFTPLQEPALQTAFEAQGLKYENHARLDGWSLLRFCKPHD